MRYYILLVLCLLGKYSTAQRKINDESIRYQQERMVFRQWDKNKFTPTSGFLGVNPYYWLTWGLMPSYKKTDLRPLSSSGPQTQRLGLVDVMSSTEDAYKLQSDTLRNTALLEIANHSGSISATDPLWMLYYSKELRPVLENSANSILKPLPPIVKIRVITEGLYDWYKKELDMLKERIEGARSADMDRGERIIAYHRLLLEYRVLAASWLIRTASAKKNIEMGENQKNVRSGLITFSSWTPESDITIAKDVVRTRKY